MKSNTRGLKLWKRMTETGSLTPIEGMTLCPWGQVRLEKNDGSITGWETQKSQLLLKKVKTNHGITWESVVQSAQVWGPSDLGLNGSSLFGVWPWESSLSLKLTFPFCKMGILSALSFVYHRVNTEYLGGIETYGLRFRLGGSWYLWFAWSPSARPHVPPTHPSAALPARPSRTPSPPRGPTSLRKRVIS